MWVAADSSSVSWQSTCAIVPSRIGDPLGPRWYGTPSNRERGSVTLFEPDFEAGSTVQIMSRDNTLMIESVRQGIAACNRIVGRGGGLLSLYIDCAGRASARSGSPVEEAEVVTDSIDRSIALAGFYSGVEIAPFAGYSRPLDWTGLLAVLRRRP